HLVAADQAEADFVMSAVLYIERLIASFGAIFGKDPIQGPGARDNRILGLAKSATAPRIKARQQHGLCALDRRLVVGAEWFIADWTSRLTRPRWGIEEIAPAAAFSRFTQRVAGQAQRRAGHS